MREIRPSGSEGGGVLPRALPTPINLKQGWSGDLVEDQGRFPILFLVRWPDLGLIVRR